MTITLALVRGLVADQHPDLADRDLRHVAGGWDNETYRLGGDLAVRLPRRRAAADLLAHERRALPELAPRLPVAVPTPVRVGEAARGYPWTWHVVPWFEGEVAGSTPLPLAAATQLGRVLAALHTPAPPDAPANRVRGVPLHTRAAAFEQRAASLERRGRDVDVLRATFTAGLTAPAATERVWLHGDLHPRNLLLRDGDLVAVLDWGDVTAGDPATDLAVAWLACDAHGRAAIRDAVGERDRATWRRAAGWAAHLAATFLDAGLHDDPTFAATGARAADELATDEEVGA